MSRRAWLLLCYVISATMLQLCVALSSNINDGDRITSLVGQPPVGFQQFAGYIPVNDEQEKARALFYYFVEAEANPFSKPLVLSLTGGPRNSAVGMAFVRNGPFWPNGNGRLVRNHYSWNKVANMLYWDSPAGVGFSYSTNMSFYNFVNDEITARDNFRFLQNWLERFPEYKSRDLFITGESYAGHFVPQLANLVLNSNLKSNLKGILIGSPLLEFNTDYNSKAEYWWSHGLISDLTYHLLNMVCNASEIARQATKGQLFPACARVISQAYQESKIRHYIHEWDISADVCSSSTTGEKTMKQDGKANVCVTGSTTTYMNRNDVQRALHAKLIGVKEWAIFTLAVKYDLQDAELPILPLLGTLIKSGVRVSVYSGDQDPLIPFTGTRIDVSKLASELGLNTTVAYQAWLQGRKVGGWTQVFGDGLSFALIRGAGHVSPLSQPERSLLVFSKFLEGKPLPLAH